MAKTAEDREWEINQAASTLIEAEKIRQDKGLHKAVKTELAKRSKAAAAAMAKMPGKKPKAQPKRKAPARKGKSRFS